MYLFYAMYQVSNELSGNKFFLNPKQTILAAALEHGINLPYGCEKGLCGKCKALVIEGKIIHTKPLPKGISNEDFNDGYRLMCQSRALSNITIAVDELSSGSDIVSKNYTAKVVKINRVSSDVIILLLKTPSGDSMQFLAGQYIDLSYPNFEPRSFSIANTPNNKGEIELHIRLIDHGQFTQFIFNELKEKTLLQLEGPKGSFYFRDNNRPIIMIAGGTGLGPIKSIIEQIINDYKQPIMLYWGVRDEVDLYTNLPQKWADKYQYLSFVPVLSKPNKKWQGRIGFVHKAVLGDYQDLSNYDIYACGPPIMVESIAETFVKKGMNKHYFYVDSFEFQTATT